LQKAGINIEPAQQSGARLVEQALQFTSLFNGMSIDLPADDQLERQIRSVRLEAKSYGVRLQMNRTPRDGHCDLLSSVAISAVAAKNLSHMPAVCTLDVPLRGEWPPRRQAGSQESSYWHGNRGGFF
jgi:hypothetical protein